ncbi:MAG: DUF4349 domain-containing protein [Candidatus Diapherotrites archaeon]
MNFLKIALIFSLFVLVSGCLGEMGETRSLSNDSDYYGDSIGGGFAEEAKSAPSSAMDFSQKVAQGERVVIKSGSASVEVVQGTLEQKLVELKQLIANNGGTVENIRYSSTESSKSYNIEVKVPPTSFDSISSGLQNIGTMKSLSTNSDDVTYEYIDLEAQIKNLEVQKQRLLEIYTKAETIESIVELESEINRVQTRIDSSTSRKNFIERQAARATLNINIFEEAPIIDKSLILPLNDAVNTLIAALGVGIIIISGLIGFAIPFVIVLLIIIGIIKVLRKYLFKNLKIPYFDKKK